jgi:hypothetical protein
MTPSAKKFLCFGSMILMSLTMTLPALSEGFTNIKIADISDEDLQNYCEGQLGSTSGDVTMRRGQTTVGCRARVQETASTKSEAAAAARASAQRAGIGGQLSISGNGSVGFTAVITSSYRRFNLDKFCRETVDGSWFNPITKEGRVFVAEGGRACHKTVRN